MILFPDHNFATDSGGAQPDVILSEHAADRFGFLNFLGPNLVSTNASGAGYVDAYVLKYGTGQFIFPVGTIATWARLRLQASTMGAYFYSDPNTAVTSNNHRGDKQEPF